MPSTRKSSASHRRSRVLSKSRCIACNSTKLLTQETEAIPSPWLKALHQQAIPTHTLRFRYLANACFPDTTPCNADIRIQFTRSTPALPRRVLYWAAGPCAVTEASELHGAERAYGNYHNMGVATRKGHTLELMVQTPYPYVAQQRGTKQAQQWCRHVHFIDLKTIEYECKTGVVTKKQYTKATSNNILFTVAAFPRIKPLTLEGGTYTCMPVFRPDQPSGQAYCKSMFINFEQYLMAKAHGAVGINAIQANVSLPIYQDDMIIDWRVAPSVIATQMAAAKVSCETPLVVYCDGGAAAQELLYKLTQTGYCNTYYFQYGMAEARAKLAGMQRFMGEGVRDV